MPLFSRYNPIVLLLLLSPMPMDAVELAYPPTERGEQVDTYEGPEGAVEVADPYRWLEEDVRESDRVAAWVAQQQALTEAYLSSLPEREAFKKRLAELWNFERRSAPRRLGKPGKSPRQYLYRRNDGLQNQSVLWVTNDYSSDGRVLIDPNDWSADGTISMGGYASSDDGQLLAYLRSESGSDWKTIRVLEIATGKPLEEVIHWVKFSGLQWATDSSGFYYNRYPEPEEGEAFQAVVKNPMVMFHRLGTPQAEDIVIYKDPDHPDWGCHASLTEDGQRLLLIVSRGTDSQNRLYVRDARAIVDPTEDSRLAWKAIVGDFKNEFSPIGCIGNRLYMQTDYEAPNRRVVAIDLVSVAKGLASDAKRPVRERLEEIVPESEATLEWASLVGGKLFVGYLHDVAAEVRVHDPASGQLLNEVALPGVGSVGGFGGTQRADETFYTYTSFDAPPTTYHYDIATGKSEKLFEPDAGVDFSQLTVRRDFFTSKDGTRVPIFLAHRKDLKWDGTNPTLLYGYGGFTVSLTPGYSPSRLAWIERGGVLAVANLRGGGEYGEAWHAAGKGANKQNVFDDFIAAAEWLIEKKITQPEHLAIQGGSNGGLLVGAVMTQRPELFGACLPAVGVMDMLRFHRFTAGQFWRDEYGSADDPELFPVLRSYSPYHNLRAGIRYPATLITTADTDDRVVPMHSFKFAAALQHAQAGDSPALIRIESRAGHGAGTPTNKRIEQAADLWSFLWEHLGVNRKIP